MPRIIRITLVIIAFMAAIAFRVQAADFRIDVLTAKGTINPVLVDYIQRGIKQSENTGATALIIQLDTPGGLDTAMRDIVQAINNSRVPVVVYVSPSGARAASAGAYITMAAHVAAMAPNTVIGAATPVQMGEEGEVQMSDEMKKKVINDAAAYLRSIAEQHGRNADWAERAVRDGISATEQEALKLNVVDMVTPELDTLVTQLDGRTVKMLDGRVLTLQTRGATVNRVPMTMIEDFLSIIAHPNIAYILLGLGMLGVTVELLNPGLIFPGVVGGISLLLAFFALGLLPVNYTGVLLIALAFGFFVAEAFTASFGLLLSGGIISLVIGSLILFKGGSPVFRVDPGLIALVTIIIGGTFAFVIERVIRAHRRQPSAGWEELIGRTAVVRAVLNPEGTVFLEGEHWAAVSNEGRIEPGEEVTITKVDGLKLWVNKRKKEEK